MNYEQATRILDRTQEGWEFSEFVILRALELTGDYELFVDEIQEIVEEIEEETGEELSDEEIKTLGEQYLKYISEETT